MFNKKIKEKIIFLEKNIDSLKDEITVLRNQIHDLGIIINKIDDRSKYRNNIISEDGFSASFQETLMASEIIERFEELYNHLGVNREIIPPKGETGVLVKNKK